MRALVIATALAAAALVGLAPAAANAAPPSAVQIQLHVTAFCCPEFGTWEATGGIGDAGTYVVTGGQVTGSLDPCFCVPPVHTGAFQEEFLLTSSSGTVTVKAEERLVPTADGSFPPSTGVWQIASGLVRTTTRAAMAPVLSGSQTSRSR